MWLLCVFDCMLAVTARYFCECACDGKTSMQPSEKCNIYKNMQITLRAAEETIPRASWLLCSLTNRCVSPTKRRYNAALDYTTFKYCHTLSNSKASSQKLAGVCHVECYSTGCETANQPWPFTFPTEQYILVVSTTTFSTSVSCCKQLLQIQGSTGCCTSAVSTERLQTPVACVLCLRAVIICLAGTQWS